MKIAIRDIPTRGLELTEQITPESIGLLKEDVGCISPLGIKAKIERTTDVVLVEIQLQLKLNLECTSCLDLIEKIRSLEFSLDYKIEKTTEFIDLGEDIRQEIILRIPTRILCREDCHGMCFHCGANLNKEKCECQKEVTKAV